MTSFSTFDFPMPLADSQSQPSTPGTPDTPRPRRNQIYILQVQAFLEAAEETDIDQDTFDDIVACLDDDDATPHTDEVRPEPDDALDLEANDGFDDPEYNALVEECELFDHSERIGSALTTGMRPFSGPRMV